MRGYPLIYIYDLKGFFPSKGSHGCWEYFSVFVLARTYAVEGSLRLEFPCCENFALGWLMWPPTSFPGHLSESMSFHVQVGRMESNTKFIRPLGPGRLSLILGKPFKFDGLPSGKLT
jgi:hypothetical protein